jgi:hypothetical protein
MAAYVTLEEVKDQIEKGGTDDDATIVGMVEAASRAIDDACNRPDGFVALGAGSETARLYSGSGAAVQWIDECVAITKVEVKDSPTDATYTLWAAGDYVKGRGDPRTRPDFNHTPYDWIMVDPTGDYSQFTSGRYAWRRGFRPDMDADYSRGVPTVKVTARWGYAATVPPEVKQACIIQVARWYKRGQSAFADTVGNADMGVLMYRKNLDPDIVQLLVNGRFVRPAVG